MVKTKLERNIKAKVKELPKANELADPDNLDLREFFSYSGKEIEFIEQYKKTLDPLASAKAVGVDPRTVQNWVKKPKVRDAMQKIQDAYIGAALMDKDVAASQFMDTLVAMQDKFIHEGDTKVASALAAMHGHHLKATGQFGNGGDNSAPQVVVNIDLGNDSSPKNITPKVSSGN